MRRTGVVLASVALALAGLTACSNADQEYCDTVKDMGNNFLSSAASDPGSNADKFQQIADVAPSDVKEDWQTIADFMKAVSDDPASAAGQSSGVQSALSNVQKDIQDRCS